MHTMHTEAPGEHRASPEEEIHAHNPEAAAPRPPDVCVWARTASAPPAVYFSLAATVISSFGHAVDI